MDDQISFIVAMRDYFGYRPEGDRAKDTMGNPFGALPDFSGELKALTSDDKQEFANGLRSLGINCIDPS
jgi:hypothetical protein